MVLCFVAEKLVSGMHEVRVHAMRHVANQSPSFARTVVASLISSTLATITLSKVRCETGGDMLGH